MFIDTVEAGCFLSHDEKDWRIKMSKPIVDVHLFEKAYVQGHGNVAPEQVQQAVDSFRFGFPYGFYAQPIIDAYVTLEAYLNAQHSAAKGEPSQLHERTFIPATREGIMAFFRSENFDLAGLTPDNRKEIFLNILQGSDDITENLLHELCSNYNTSLGEVPPYVRPPEPTLSNEHKYDELRLSGWTFSGLNSSTVIACKVVGAGTKCFVSRSYDEVLESAWAYHTEESKQAYDELNQKTFDKIKGIKRRYAENRGWEFSLSVARNKQKNLRFVRNTEAELIQAAYNYEVLS